MNAPVRDRDWRALAAGVAGEVILPGSSAYDQARRPAGERFADVRPQAVIRCAGTSDVIGAVAFARRFAVPMAIRSGGHDFAGRSSTSGLLLDLSRIDRISLTGGTVAIGAGARLSAVDGALHRTGRAIPGGSGASVAIAGLALGGGLGLLGRSHGLTCDSLLRAQVVLADGRVVWCDQGHEADLFWALRGAGAGSFGVVTELVFKTVPAPRCTAFELTWDYAAAAQVLAAWQSWAPDGPAELAASLLLNAAADPRYPPWVTVLGAAPGLPRERTGQLLDTLVSSVGSGSLTRWCTQGSWLDAKTVLARRAPGAGTGRSYSKSGFFDRRLPAMAIGELAALFAADRVAGEARELDFTPWAGAYNRIPAEATSFPHRADLFLLKHAVTLVPGTAASPASPSGWLSRSWELVRPYGTGGAYPNFPDPDLADPARAYFGLNLRRLARTKHAYDPEDVFAALGSRLPREPTSVSRS